MARTPPGRGRRLYEALRHPLCALERVRGRLRGPAATTAEALALHAAAEAAGEPTYRDPTSGRAVYTAAWLRGLEQCCGLGCRHCPYP